MNGTSMRTVRHAAVGLMALLVTAGCGTAVVESAATSGADAPVDATPLAMPASAEPAGSPATAADAGASGGLGDEANTAVVTIGDERYEFSDLYCVTLGGALSAQSMGSDPSVGIDLPPADWETDTNSDWSPPNVEVDLDEDGQTWIADPTSTALIGIEDHPGLSGVDSYEVDGHRASGTAMFIEAAAWTTASLDADAALPEPVQGTFEVVCAPR